MSWRPLGPTKRYASRRRILAALGPKNAGPPQGPFSIVPYPPVADGFTSLVQENLGRLKCLDEEALAHQKLSSLRKQIKRRKEANTATHKNVNKPQQVEPQEEPQEEPQVPVINGSNAKTDDPPNLDREESFEQDEAFHRDLDYVLDAFRALQDRKPQREISSTEPETVSEPEPELTQLDQPRRTISALSHSPREHPVSADYRPSKKPAFLRRNATIDHGIGGRNIREHLKLWQAHRSSDDTQVPLDRGASLSSTGCSQNTLTQSAEDGLLTVMSHEDDVDEELLDGIDAEDSTLNILHAPKFLRKGDLVEFGTTDEPILAIFIKNFERTALFYTDRGAWLVRRSEHTRFSVPNFVDPSMMKDILQYVPSEESHSQWLDRLQPMKSNAPRNVGSTALGMMQRFRVASDRVYRKYADRLNHAYEIMAPKLHVDGTRAISLQDVALRIFEKKDVSELSPPMLWTIHRTLSNMQNVTTDLHTHRLNPQFEFIPKQDLAQMNELKRWTREFRERRVEERINMQDSNLLGGDSKTWANPVASFVDKARGVVLNSRQTRAVSPAGCIGPCLKTPQLAESKSKLWSVAGLGLLNAKERVVVDYLDAWVTAQYLNRNSELRSLGPMILRSVGLYQDYDLDESTGFLFLQELGLVAPWQDASLYRTRLGVPGYDSSHAVTILRNQAFEPRSMSTLEDTMLDYRKDWGHIPVYCIDSADTEERDDGISLEEIAGEESSAWLHVHVANPSAFIDTGSIIAQYAAKVSESIYLPEVKHPMLNPRLSGEYFSLGKDRPCITFSAKINAIGEILETAVSHGILHNVYYITPQRLEDELGLANRAKQSSTTMLRVGRFPPPVGDMPQDLNPRASQSLSSEDIRILNRLRSMGEATRHRRERAGAIPLLGYNNPRKIVQPEILFGEGVINPAEPLSKHFRRFDGDPVISLVIKTDSGGEISTMIADLMVVGGEVCAKWCMDRRLPVPYRGIRMSPEPAIDPAVFKQEVLDPAIQKHGQADENDLLRYLRLLGSIDCSSSPLEHIALGLPAYVKATSPLRRYSDLLTHWQIEAAIRHEKRTQRSLLKSKDRSFLPFSYELIEATSKQLVGRASQMQIIRNGSLQHWFTLAFFRAFYFKEAPLPDVFRVKITELGTPAQSVRGILLDWGKSVSMQDNPSITNANGGYQLDDIWEVSIHKISVYRKIIDMEPLRLISRSSLAHSQALKP